jgi:hypothetical protein
MQIGGYRVSPTRRAVTVGNKAPAPGLASKGPGGSVPATLAWPRDAPAALRRHRQLAARRSYSRSFAAGDTFVNGTPTSSRRSSAISGMPMSRKQAPAARSMSCGSASSCSWTTRMCTPPILVALAGDGGYGGCASMLRPAWARKPSMRSGRHWICLSRVFTVAASWTGLLRDPPESVRPPRLHVRGACIDAAYTLSVWSPYERSSYPPGPARAGAEPRL